MNVAIGPWNNWNQKEVKTDGSLECIVSPKEKLARNKRDRDYWRSKTASGPKFLQAGSRLRKLLMPPGKACALILLQMCPKRITRKEGSPKVRSQEPRRTMELPPDPLKEHPWGRGPSCLFNGLSELLVPGMAVWPPSFLFPSGEVSTILDMGGQITCVSAQASRSRGTKSRPDEELTVRPWNSDLTQWLDENSEVYSTGWEVSLFFVGKEQKWWLVIEREDDTDCIIVIIIHVSLPCRGFLHPHLDLQCSS